MCKAKALRDGYLVSAFCFLDTMSEPQSRGAVIVSFCF